jgi:hypothetical protein
MNKFRKLGFIEYNRARAETSGTTRSRLNSRLWRACPEHPPSRGCSFGLVPVLVRVRRSRGKQRTPPATVCSTAHARGRTRRRFPLRARPRRVLSCGGRCRTDGRSPAGTWTPCQLWSPSGPRIAGRGSAASTRFRQSEDEEWAVPWRPRGVSRSRHARYTGVSTLGNARQTERPGCRRVNANTRAVTSLFLWRQQRALVIEGMTFWLPQGSPPTCRSGPARSRLRYLDERGCPFGL